MTAGRTDHTAFASAPSLTPHDYRELGMFRLFLGSGGTQDDYARIYEPHDALRDMAARKDAAYYERNQVVAALAKCFPSGVARTAIEGWSEDWHGCVYIDLPTGQASWHFHDSQAHLFAGLPAYTKPWDGHTTEEKYARLAALQTVSFTNCCQKMDRAQERIRSLEATNAHLLVLKKLGLPGR
jgi:hypothetical protein